VKFDAVRERLRAFPTVLPPPPSSIDARVIAQADRLPAWITSSRGAAARRAAGLCLLFPDSAGEAHIVLTERPAGDLRHAGQISLPGGAEDPGDAFPVGTALREAREEVGLDTDGVQIVGELDVVDVRVSGFLLTPVVGLIDRLPALTPDTREVASIVLAPIDAFLPGSPVEIVEADRDGFRLRYGAYVVQGHHVWGATARVMGQLGALLGAEPPASAPS
jgi:8-oxo-dGTP pyrophosphatase MutT (NUDIX family)